MFAVCRAAPPLPTEKRLWSAAYSPLVSALTLPYWQHPCRWGRAAARSRHPLWHDGQRRPLQFPARLAAPAL